MKQITSIEKDDIKRKEESAENNNIHDEQVINKDFYFVKVGSDIYFRRYGQYTLDRNTLFENFLDYQVSGGPS